ncbi:MAG TPA: DUF4440 domain-containing protein [Terriglobales bacterium]
MEPELTTNLSPLRILEELKNREPIFHRPEHGTTRADFDRMIAPEFWETGASGRRYRREYVLNVLDQRRSAPPSDEWQPSDFHCQQLAATVFLLTYTLIQGERETRRSSIWRQVSNDWQIVYHQGTVVQK